MSINSMFALVQDDLAAIETQLSSIIHSPVALVSDIGQHLLLAGGKRLRPALYLLCAKSGKADSDAKLAIAAAIEMIHMATLVHDDVLDDAATRRGLATAKACWGNHTAILAGDFLFAKAFATIAQNDSGPMLNILTKVICSICEGEIIQNRDCYNTLQSEDDYLRRIAQKTADFLAASCELGGLSAELPSADVAALKYYGYAIGMAFQITDDILDITASSVQLGKPSGNDLSQGILTLPVLFALAHSKDRLELSNLITKKNIDQSSLARGLAIVKDSEGIEYSYKRVQHYLAEARNSLPPSVKGGVRQNLIDIADFVGLRKY